MTKEEDGREMEPCKQEKELERLTARVEALESTVATLREQHIETKFFMKQVLDALADVKQQMKEIKSEMKEMALDMEESAQTSGQQAVDVVETTTNAWKPVVMELIKAIGLIAGIVAGIKLL